MPAASRRALIAHARAAAPRECCGLLLGRGRDVWHVLPVRNVDDRPPRYRLDPRTHIEVRRMIRDLTPPLVILGVYHSHPHGAPLPSAADIAEAAYPGWLHVIVGLGTGRPRVAAFRIRDGRVRAVSLVSHRGRQGSGVAPRTTRLK